MDNETRDILQELRNILEIEKKIFYQLIMATNSGKTGETEYLLKEILVELRKMNKSKELEKKED